MKLDETLIDLPRIEPSPTIQQYWTEGGGIITVPTGYRDRLNQFARSRAGDNLPLSTFASGALIVAVALLSILSGLLLITDQIFG